MSVICSSIILSLIFASDVAAQGRPGKGNFRIQLHRIFGRFRNADLKRVFDKAKPVPCSDLVSGDGRWREVAFFNEYRPFGDWHRTSLAEVKRDLAAYIFRGACTGAESGA